MKKLTKILTAVSFLALAGNAAAVQITGSIGFNGAYTHDGSSLSDATTITIIDSHVSGVVTGSFAADGIVDGQASLYSNFTFDPVGPVAGIWSVTGNTTTFTFDLNDMAVDFQSASLLALSGTGMITSDNAALDDAFGKWTFTANQTGSNFTWSSSSAPEPGVALLLGAGLIGFSVARKLRKST
jgi:hypothetical protein